ncbi:MAG: lipid-binding SYLF domain-containing protein [Acidobacteriota bacterium]|nr:MAG: lipid-binding SYLF domain-containing protein [Acidobacteriota bacterium]
MIIKFAIKTICCLFLAAVALQGTSLAQNKDKADAISQANKAATVFREIMAVTDKSVPRSLLDKAYCVAVFPQVIKAGFIVGGRGGRGVASCRTNGAWSAPAYFDLKGGSFGLQIGAQATDFVLLFMTSDGINSLLKSKFEMGADASVAAGPVGREVGAATDLRLNAQILSYSRSKGLFAGLELKGSVISLDKDDMEAVYGRGFSAEQVLKGTKAAPAAVKVYPDTLARYSRRRK